MTEETFFSEQPIIGVSACLLGHNVRYDGGHKRDSFIAEILGREVEFLPVCPEAAIGLGVPRPMIHLVGDPRQPRLVGVQDPTMDVTRRMEAYAADQARQLNGISGYILKKNSPSCGMERVKVYAAESGGHCVRKGTGAFARVLMAQRPLLPVEEEGRLNDAVLRENFVNRVYVYQRWHNLHAAGLTPARLIAFHTDHKYLVMAHSQAAYQRLGRLLSNLSKSDLDKITHSYIHELMPALKRRVTRKRHVNVLQHIMGYLKKRIGSDDKRELSANIEAYRRGETPLVVPITLFRHYFRIHPDEYMLRQIYLQPHPDSLGLRNGI
ncbi:MAG: DUF523 and DUF1722 domain-containing protein [Candidatus Thiodiazotropha sp. (ex Ctena orbiculata)]|nr:DUF523 and DUF1722 domain-containing protein [Candidatus Thiodiazotropha taylori]MBT2998538.1 DUF523 and DUF1722 domain-containing protein [Candidatus Thiodiazotropha taylori]MBV2109175.1 DUF523 and DUF1722 domain-containing protein [Candidatus Thiodiazotropha taylori]MBV2113074.1 DUF523 and DUF1722 domain-containing protein [Candidatus Thiodiazotropha taylori]